MYLKKSHRSSNDNYRTKYFKMMDLIKHVNASLQNQNVHQTIVSKIKILDQRRTFRPGSLSFSTAIHTIDEDQDIQNNSRRRKREIYLF